MKARRIRLFTAALAALLLAVFSFGGGLAAFAADIPAAPRGIAVSFYNDPYTTRGFAWTTNASVTDPAVQYVEAGGIASAGEVDWSAANVRAVSGTHKIAGEYASHKAHITGLTPGTKYYYRVGSPETNSFSAPAAFVTDAEENGALSFVHLTDAQEVTQKNYGLWGKVLDSAYQTVPDSKFVAFTGDLTNDNHAKLNMNQWIWALDEAPALRETAIMPAAGNHDALNTAFADRFDIDYPGSTQRGAYYSFDYGDLHFVTLNTNESNYDAQLAWLEEDLAGTDKKWKVVQMHKGLISTGDHTHDGDVKQLRDLLLPLMAKYRVDLVLQGHDHVYTRSMPYSSGTDLTGGQYSGRLPNTSVTTVTERFDGKETVFDVEPDGTYYVTINYSSTKQYPPVDYDKSLIYPAIYNGTQMSVQPGLPMFGAVRIEGDRLTYDAYTVDVESGKAELFDHFGVLKNTHEAVNGLIEELPEQIDARYANELAAAKSAYDALTPRAKQRVAAENSAKLASALETLDLTEALAAYEAIRLIDAIGTVGLSAACEERIEAAEAAYFTLTEYQRELVVNYAEIAAAKAAVLDMRFASGVEALIASLEKDPALTAAARKAYDNLTEAQKAYVSNYAALVAAEEKQAPEAEGCGCAAVTFGGGGAAGGLTVGILLLTAALVYKKRKLKKTSP